MPLSNNILDLFSGHRDMLKRPQDATNMNYDQSMAWCWWSPEKMLLTNALCIMGNCVDDIWTGSAFPIESLQCPF